MYLSKQWILIFALIGWMNIETANAQAKNEEPIIDIKQRILKPKKHSEEDIKITQDSTRSLRLMIAGNIYQTEKHANYCFDEATGKYNFREELKYIQPILSLGDIAIANLKTSFANDARNMHSSPDEFALALKYSGINVLTHANMHAANIDKATLTRTRDMLYNYEMYHTGAFSDNMQRIGNYPLIVNKKGFRVAILNYAILNNRPNISRDFIINEADKLYIERDMRMARVNKPDFTIVCFDWGANQQTIPSAQQIELAQYCFQQGADLVVGAHPNAPMRIDYVPYVKNGASAEGIVAYSLGNLVASNDEVRNRNGYVIDMELVKNNFTNETTMGDWGVIPVYTHYDTSVTKGAVKVYSVPCSAVENGDILNGMAYIEKRRVVNGAFQIRQLLGATADEIQYNLTEHVANNVMETINLINSALNNKYNQKKEKDLAPSAAPILPVASAGSNNPPSLAMIYGNDPTPITSNTPTKPSDKTTPVVAAKEPEKKINKEKEIASEMFNNNEPAATVTTEAPNTKTEIAKTETASNIPQTTNNTEALNTKTEITNSKPQTTNNTEAPNAKTETTKPESTNNKPQTTNNTEASNTKTESNKPETANNEHQTTSNTEALNTKAENTNNKPQTANNNTAPIAKPETANNKPQTKTETETTKPSAITNDKPIVSDLSIEKVKELNVKLVIDTFYRIQFYALQKFIPLDTNYYTHLKGYEVIQEDGYYKYLLGKYRTYEECEKVWRAQIQPRYKNSFVVKYIDGKRITER